MLSEIISNLESSIMKGDTDWENLDDHIEVAVKDVTVENKTMDDVKQHLMTCCIHREYML